MTYIRATIHFIDLNKSYYDPILYMLFLIESAYFMCTLFGNPRIVLLKKTVNIYLAYKSYIDYRSLVFNI
jgi:hypothetical protein